MLDTLKSRHRLALATNRSHTAAKLVCCFGLDRWLEVTGCMLDVTRPKPYPDVIEHVLRCLDLRPDQAVYVGLSVTDMDAAGSASVGIIAVSKEAWAPLQVRELREVPALLEEMGHG